MSITRLIPNNVRVAVQQHIAPYANLLHREGGDTDEQMLNEIRTVLAQFEKFRDVDPVMRDADVAHIAAAAQVILERRVQDRAAA